jgi:lipoate-protein ligase A
VTVADLYDYGELRRSGVPTATVVHPRGSALVLGSSQSEDVLDPARCEMPHRRRRGGGGVVLVSPGDLWIDWWIPADDERWRSDARASSQLVGQWWASALAPRVAGPLSVHHGGLEGDANHRVVCFAGRGPGEVFASGRKVVGVTQWRVREGVFLSSMIPARDSREVLSCLVDVPAGLAGALDHHTVASLALDESVVEEALAVSGTWAVGPSPNL